MKPDAFVEGFDSASASLFFFLNNRKIIWKELDFSPSDEFRFMVKD